MPSMEVVKSHPMNGGFGDASYATNSLLQKKVISMIKPIIEEAITELYNSSIIKNLSIADMGCSTGPNTLLVATELVTIVDKLRRKHGHDQSPEFQIYLNDLPGNDYNSIFQSLVPRFQADLRPGFGQCFVSAVPGTFYGRLFPSKTLHFVHSSYSLMWLSKEVVSGGKMVLTIMGRTSNDDLSIKDSCYIWELLAVALQEMVAEGLIEADKLHSFNVPLYTPSAAEVETEVVREGSFTIDRLETSEIKWTACDNDDIYPIEVDVGYNVTKCMRSVAEPLLIQQFGELVMNQLFDKYEKIISDRMSKEATKFSNVTVSLTKRE